MLDDPVTASRDLITIAHAIRLHDFLFLISITFLYFDHLITFGDEIRFLWRKTKTASTYCFLLNRYLAFFGDIVVTYFVFTTVPESVCKSVNFFRQLLLIFNQTTICLLLTVRIYALYGRQKKVWAYMLGAGAFLMGVSLWAISGNGGRPVPGVNGCHISNSRTIGIRLSVPWISLSIYDWMIFVALFYKSWQARSESVTRRSDTLLSVLIRDGAIYFIVMAVMNLANILTFYIAPPLLRGCLATMASSLSVTMMSRLMLNLHAVESKGIFSTAHIKYTASFDSDVEPVELDTLWTRDLERSVYVPAQEVSSGSPTLNG
ncbi:hypothetical protein C8R47DRAFT_556678 [Mycena vitilis]|nr:hypothetical protein C8R47DRAFT_556678 [Mycena vitilis]